MYRKTIITVCLLAGLLVVLAFAMLGKAPKTPAEEPQAALDFTLTDVKGKMHNLSQYRGKVVFLNFWATWCPPCRAEMPSIQQLHEEADQDKFVVLTVSVREPEKLVKDFVAKNNHTFQVLLDPVGRVAAQYEVNVFPTTFIIDQQGKTAAKIIGSRHWLWDDLKAWLK